MIPRHRNAGTQFESDISLRVSACRKRMRRLRTGRNSAEPAGGDKASLESGVDSGDSEHHMSEAGERVGESDRAEE